MRRLLGVALAAHVACFGLLPTAVQAQVVIRERVEVRPGPVSVPGPVSDAWPGGLRGRGTVRVQFWGALLRDQPLSALTATISTTTGRLLTIPLTGPLVESATVCLPTHDPTWTACEQRRYGRVEEPVLSFALAADEELDSLRVTGPGVDVGVNARLSEYANPRTLDDLQLGCGYHYYAWPPGYHFSDCNCMQARTGEVHGQISFRYEFTPDPAERLLVTAAHDSLRFAPGTPYASQLDVEAVYADGTPAPFGSNTLLTYTTGSLAYGSLRAERSGYPPGVLGRGATWTTKYRLGDRMSYVADGVDGSGGPPVTVGPVCDEPVTVSVSGGGLSGSAELVIRGSSTATAPDTLLVTTEPDTLVAGERATIRGELRNVDGCELSGTVPDSTAMAVSISTGAVGLLEYDGQRASSFAAVPYGDLRAGAVTFVSDTTASGGPLFDVPVEVTVSGAGLTGQDTVVVLGRMCPSGETKTGEICETVSFRVAVNPNPLDYFESALVTLEVQNINIEDSANITISIEPPGEQYVRLYQAHEPFPFDGGHISLTLPYAYINAQNVRLAYNGEMATQPGTTVRIRATVVNDPSITASTDVGLETCDMPACIQGGPMSGPQTFSPMAGVPKHALQSFPWIGADGHERSGTIPNECTVSEPEKRGETRPYLLPRSSLMYDFASDSRISVCRVADGSVNVSLEFPDVPVFMDTCPPGPGQIDLVNVENMTFEQFVVLIPESEEDRLLSDLEYWRMGPYLLKTTLDYLAEMTQNEEADARRLNDRRAANGWTQPKYYVSSSVMLHEQQHLESWRKAMEQEMNEALDDIYEQRNSFLCEREGVARARAEVTAAVNNMEFRRTRGLSHSSHAEEELEADRAREVRARRARDYSIIRRYSRMPRQ